MESERGIGVELFVQPRTLQTVHQRERKWDSAEEWERRKMKRQKKGEKR
jgi:hypothetical protein